jgi:hypothetical protein
MARPWLKRVDPDEDEKRDPYQPLTGYEDHTMAQTVERSVKLL